MRFHSFFWLPQKVSRSQRARTVAQAESRSSFLRAAAKESGGVLEIDFPDSLRRSKSLAERDQLPLIAWRSMMLCISSEVEAREVWAREGFMVTSVLSVNFIS